MGAYSSSKRRYGGPAFAPKETERHGGVPVPPYRVEEVVAAGNRSSGDEGVRPPDAEQGESGPTAREEEEEVKPTTENGR